MNLATYEYQSDTFRNYIEKRATEIADQRVETLAERAAHAEAEAVLTVLAARGVEVPDDTRRRITECTGLDQLEAWLRRAVTVGSIEELFD